MPWLKGVRYPRWSRWDNGKSELYCVEFLDYDQVIEKRFKTFIEALEFMGSLNAGVWNSFFDYKGSNGN